MGEIIDIVAVTVMVIAVLRGIWIGIVREAFSLAALAAAVLAFRALRAPVAAEIAARTQWDPLIATAAAGGAVVVAALVFVTLAGAIVRRLVGVAGLSGIDRVGGAALGAAEGVLVIALALFAVTEVLGSKDPLLAGSRTVAIFESWRGGEPPHPARGVSSGRPSARGDGSGR